MPETKPGRELNLSTTFLYNGAHYGPGRAFIPDGDAADSIEDKNRQLVQAQEEEARRIRLMNEDLERRMSDEPEDTSEQNERLATLEETNQTQAERIEQLEQQMKQQATQQATAIQVAAEKAAKDAVTAAMAARDAQTKKDAANAAKANQSADTGITTATPPATSSPTS